jgi:monoterpene epsilon-lactone hydrolase
MLRSLLQAFLRLAVKPVMGPACPVALQRHWFTTIAKALPQPRGIRREHLDLGGVPAERTMPRAPSGPILLYFHGGGYCIGSLRTCRSIAAHLARLTTATVYAPDYRLAPEHPHPAALEDALACYRALLASGIAAQRLIVGGDSAGGGLAVATAVALRDAQLPLPAALVVMSPWVDLGCDGATHSTVGNRDPVLTTAGLRRWAQAYLGPRAASDPACSPVYADLSGLPPILIQVGSEEILHADATRLRERATRAGVTVELHEFSGLWHDFQMYAGWLREADQALAKIADFIRRHIRDGQK